MTCCLNHFSLEIQYFYVIQSLVNQGNFVYFISQNPSSVLLLAACLFATVYSAIGMSSIVYRDGNTVCEACDQTHTYTTNQRVVSSHPVITYNEERVVVNRAPGSSSSISQDDSN